MRIANRDTILVVVIVVVISAIVVGSFVLFARPDPLLTILVLAAVILFTGVTFWAWIRYATRA